MITLNVFNLNIMASNPNFQKAEIVILYDWVSKVLEHEAN